MAIDQRGSVLAGAVGNGNYGQSVALSADGAILAVGANNEQSGAGRVHVYDYSGGWTERGTGLVPSDAAFSDWFGYGVALSGDGAVLAVGAPEWEGSASNQGGVYIYDWSGGAWVQRGSVLVAGDAAGVDYFGTSVALSSDGTVLVVGAIYWEGSADAQGGVYIYDWSGGAWVQRGSVLVAGDAELEAYFGGGVAISNDGSILAVGAYQRYVASLYRGGVYIYDWSGGSWVQRGSALVAADGATADYFGYSVALSGDGATLAVGAPLWEGSASNQGGAYIYEWSGSAWVLRDSTVLVAGDAEANDNYGSGVALSDDASVLAVGSRQWDVVSSGNEGGVYVYDIDNNSGEAVADTDLTVEIATGAASADTELAMYDSGPLTAYTEVYVADIYEPTAYTELTVSWPSGSASAATELTMTATGEASADTLLAVLGAAHEPNWTARCVVGGVDLSAWLVGEATVEAEEGAARIARVVLQPDSGTIAPLDYVGKTITLDYVLVIGGVDVPRRMFTGLVDTPSYDPVTTLLALDCVDDLQNRVALLERSVINDLVAGRYSEAVQGELDDNWDYAQALLSTVPASLDAGPAGGMRVTPWEISTAWATWGESDLVYREAGLTLPQRSTMVNRVDIAFDYRYSRLRQRYTSIGWSGTQADMVKTGYAYPKQQDIRGAAGGSGWTIVAEAYWPAPAAIPHPSGGFVYPDDGSIDMAVIFMAQRHAQTVTEKFTITVTAPESQALNGDLPAAIRGALASSFDGRNWESALNIAPLLTGGDEQDYAPDATRADADYAIQTLLDQANVRILGSHRGARVRNAVLCNPDLDLDKRIVIDTAGVQAAGKVVRVRHRLDFAGGSAISEFELAIFGAGGAGIITPDTLDPPDPPDEASTTHAWQAEVPSLTVSVYGSTTYTENLMGLLLNPPETITVEDVPGDGTVTYDNPYYVAGEGFPVTGFRVRMPGVDDGDRDPLEKTASQEYNLVIPSDTLTFTVP